MTRENKSDMDQSISSLIGEIVSDTQNLLKQHLALLRAELLADLRTSKRAAVVMASVLVLALVGCGCVVAMLVGLLAWLMPGIAWWCWCGIIGGLLLILTAVVYRAGKQMMSSMNLLPDQTIQALKQSLPGTAIDTV